MRFVIVKDMDGRKLESRAREGERAAEGMRDSIKRNGIGRTMCAEDERRIIVSIEAK